MSTIRTICSLVTNNSKSLILAFILSAAFSWATFEGASLIPEIILTTGDIWFESDTPRVYGNMSDRESPNWRASVHPLFSLIAFPPVFVLKKMFDLPVVLAVKLVMASVAFLWMFVLFLLLRYMGCRVFDAIILGVLSALSAASIFFFVIPETYAFGSGTILLALIFAIWSQYQALPISWHIAINVTTFSITSSNWMVAFFATVVNLPWRKVLGVIAATFLITTLLWSIEKSLFPTSKFFMDIKKEARFLLRDEGGSPLNAVPSFFLHTMVMPKIYTIEDDKTGTPGMFTQRSIPGSAGPYGRCAVVLWAALLLMGAWSLFTLTAHKKLRMVIGLSLTCQLVLHIVYGFETFLYSLHFIVLLIPLVALVFLTHMRKVAVILTCLLIPCVAVNNLKQFRIAVEYINTHPTKFINKENS
jgi:hypothetical protein